MTKRAQIHEFYKKVKIEKIFIFQATVLQFGGLLEGWKWTRNVKFHLNISKITKFRPKNTGTWDVNTIIMIPP